MSERARNREPETIHADTMIETDGETGGKSDVLEEKLRTKIYEIINERTVD